VNPLVFVSGTSAAKKKAARLLQAHGQFIREETPRKGRCVRDASNLVLGCTAQSGKGKNKRQDEIVFGMRPIFFKIKWIGLIPDHGPPWCAATIPSKAQMR
jgi:hypothetical protein